MALIDVSELMTDPDFTDKAVLIRRSSAVNTNGEHVIVDYRTTITAVIQGLGAESIQRVPEGARLSGMIEVYFQGQLLAERQGGYADIIEWRGRRYQVFDVPEEFMNHGAGFTKAICKLEQVKSEAFNA